MPLIIRVDNDINSHLFVIIIYNIKWINSQKEKIFNGEGLI